MSIAYTYKIINVNPSAKSMEIVYSSENRQTMHIGARMPYVGESLESIVQMYSPVAYWLEQEQDVNQVTEGTTGSIIPAQAQPITLDTARSEKLIQLATWRYEQEVAGIVVDGMHIKTDRESQASITNTYFNMVNGLISSVDWKMADGTFVTLTLSQITNIAQTVVNHVQRLFTLEKFYSQQIHSAQSIDAVYAITPEYDNTIPI